MNALLISTYELGRQPFGLASPAAWLRASGIAVTTLDLSVQKLDDEAVRAADLVPEHHCRTQDSGNPANCCCGAHDVLRSVGPAADYETPDCALPINTRQSADRG